MSIPGFDAIIGHKEAMRSLQSDLGDNRLSHAYLFYGPSGVGKATVATALIQTLLCQQRVLAQGLPKACGVCPPCRRVELANHVDLLRVEVESERTRILVEQIRDMNRFVALSPLEDSGWKAVIVDDAALMNEASASALLKTLEEPPTNSLIILITSRPGSLLPTILSRCRKIRFVSPDQEAMSRLIAQMREVELAVAQEAVRLSGGSMSRALALCDEKLPELRRRFLSDLEGVAIERLADLSTAAEWWSDKERYEMAVTFLWAWFQDRMRANIEKLDNGRNESLLELIGWAERLRGQAAIFNLNRQLVLEALFIRLAGWREKSV